MIISVVAAKIWYLKMCGFYWATLYTQVLFNWPIFMELLLVSHITCLFLGFAAAELGRTTHQSTDV